MENNKSFSAYKLKCYINLSAAILFSILSITFHADITILGFIIAVAYTAVTVFFSLKMILKTDGTHIMKVIKFTEYLPYVLFICFILRRAGVSGTSFAYDLITVILWFIIFVLSYLTTRCLYPKKMKK